MLLAKSCHDLDWIRHIMGAPCSRVSSFGSLYYFRPENKPAGAAIDEGMAYIPADRTEIGNAINRKRTPDLVFQVLLEGGAP